MKKDYYIYEEDDTGDTMYTSPGPFEEEHQDEQGQGRKEEEHM